MAFPTTLFGKLRDIVDESTTQKHPLGTRLVLPDGRVFRYAKNSSTALAIGKLCAAPTQLASEVVDLAPEAAVTTAARNCEFAITTTVTATTVAANKFKQGYMYINKGTGAGQVVQVKKQDAGGSTAGATVKVYFDDESYLSAALDTSTSKVGLVKNPYDSVVACPVATAGVAVQTPIGVPPLTVSAGSTTPYYFWLQTWGPCPVLMGATPAVGELVRIGSSTEAAGEVIHRAVPTSGTKGAFLDLPQIGIVMAGNTDAEYALVFLTLAP